MTVIPSRALHLIVITFAASNAWGQARLQVQPSFAPTLYVPTGDVVLRSGQLGTGLHTLAGTPRNGGSGFVMNSSVPLGRSESKRGSGWFASAAASYRPQLYARGDALAVQGSHWEVALGRAIHFLEGASETGLRGYLDLAFRDDLVLHQRSAEGDLHYAGYDPRYRSLAIGLRFGATNDPLGLGLVAQKPPRIGFLVQGALYYPLSSQGVVIHGSIEARIPTWTSDLHLGLALGAIKYEKPQVTLGAEDPSMAFTYGPTMDMAIFNRYLLQATIGWSAFRSASRNLIAGAPFVRTGLSFLY